MKRIKLAFFLCVLLIESVSAQGADTSGINQNYVYVNLIYFSSDVLELNDYWLSLGYDRKINSQMILGLNISTIIVSRPSTGAFYGPGLDVFKSVGMRYNLEGKYLLNNSFYTSLNLFAQHTKSNSTETFVVSGNLIENNYLVLRQAYSLIPKVGIIFNKDEKGVYTDLNIGLGLKYITSSTKNKISETSNKSESPSQKKFEQGTGFTYHPLTHLKVGYNF